MPIGETGASPTPGEGKPEHWQLVYATWQPDEQPLREALCALGNGYMMTRGAAEEASAGGPHYPGTYLHGGYDRLETEISGHVVSNEDLVNWPNWLPLTFRVDGGAWFHVDDVEVLGFRQVLDLRTGILERRLRFRDGDGRETELATRRLVSMRHPHAAAIRWELTPSQWSGDIEIRTAIDGTVTNAGVERYRDLAGDHIRVTDAGQVMEDGVFLTARAVQSRIRVSTAARTVVSHDAEIAAAERHTTIGDGEAAQVIRTRVESGKTLTVDKLVAIHSSRDRAISEPQEAAIRAVSRLTDFEALEDSQRQAWAEIWRRADLRMGGDGDVAQPQLALRLHVFHLVQTTSRNTIGRDVGVPSRGLHGEAYRGHVFWDELYIFPFLNLRFPELTRSLLMYRYHRLPEARWLARDNGHAGAMFPWQSGSSGREESQTLHLNPRSGRWVPDDTHRQRHVNAAIAWNVWQYHQTTGDVEFLTSYGAELLVDIARFWASLARFDTDRQRYEIRGVVGPDEFHTSTPFFDEHGLRNNAYTNVMAAWCIRRAIEALGCLAEAHRDELLGQLDLDAEDLKHWEHVASRMFVPMQDGLILQFEGWERLEEFDWDGYRQRYGDIQRLDRILEAENDDINRYRATKQADVLMLFYLFSREELEELFGGMGYRFEPEMFQQNIDHYLARTTHGSTLSRVVHAWVMARADRPGSWPLAMEALQSDLTDIQGGTTSEGIHLGAMAGSVDLFQRCYTGVEPRADVLWLNPRLPEQLERLTLRLRYRGHWLTLEIDAERLVVRIDRGWSPSVQIGHRGETVEMAQGDEHIFDLRKPAERPTS